MNLADPVTVISGVGSIMAKRLEKLEITSVFDLLYHLPFRYEDRRLVSLARQVQVGESVGVVGTITAVKNVFTKNNKRLQTASITDDSGSLAVIWFNQLYLTRAIPANTRVALFGKVDFFNKRPALISPEYELLASDGDSLHLKRLVPIYPETAGISSKWLRSKIYHLLATLPIEIVPGIANLLTWKEALTQVHFPQSLDQVAPARHRLAFDELLLLQLSSLKRRAQWEKVTTTYPLQVDRKRVADFVGRLPFKLTDSQLKAMEEILSDLQSSTPMNRLLEGDVGSGKTVVAAIAAYVAQLNGRQTLVMAPTQILANQHYQTLSDLFSPFNIQVGLVTGAKKIPSGDVIVGTQALLGAFQTNQVGLVVIDEQHRFGVAQRSLLTAKHQSPHILTMTATPIPRTVALTMYADLQLSALTELPSGRKPVKTWVVPEGKRARAYTWMEKQIQTAQAQVFVVCPFIEESESLSTVKAATVEFESLKKSFSSRRLALLHGRMKAKEKEETISRFKQSEIDILVATPVVEVGIDIPQATIMVIEGADRFGLAALHQLRGRVGRGLAQAYCLLFASRDVTRLKLLEQYRSGADLAEMDLKLRGAGDLFGTSQHGVPRFKVATYEDFGLISQAQARAKLLLPQLKNEPVLRQLVEKDKIELIQPN